MLACETKGRWFDSQSGHMPGLQASSQSTELHQPGLPTCFGMLSLDIFHCDLSRGPSFKIVHISRLCMNLFLVFSQTPTSGSHPQFRQPQSNPQATPPKSFSWETQEEAVSHSELHTLPSSVPKQPFKANADSHGESAGVFLFSCFLQHRHHPPHPQEACLP